MAEVLVFFIDEGRLVVDNATSRWGIFPVQSGGRACSRRIVAGMRLAGSGGSRLNKVTGSGVVKFLQLL